MRYALFFLFLTFYILSPVHTMADEKKEIPPVQNGWEKEADGNRSLFSSPSLFKDANFVYVYSEKLLDNLTIGIIDMQGNTYHYEVTSVPGCTYYAISIESLPIGQYYFCIYQGSNYMISMFNL